LHLLVYHLHTQPGSLSGYQTTGNHKPIQQARGHEVRFNFRMIINIRQIQALLNS